MPVAELQFRDADEASAARPWTRSEILPLEAPAAPWTVGYAKLGHATLWWGRHAAKSCACGHIPAGSALIGIPALDATGWTVNRAPFGLGEGRIAIFPPDANYVCAFDTPADYWALAAPADWLAHRQEILARDGRGLSRHVHTVAVASDAARVGHALTVARGFALAHPQLLAQERYREPLEKSVMAAIHGAIAADSAPHAHAKPRLLARLLEYLNAHAEACIYPADLCEALETSERSLRRLFPEAFGTSAARYLRVRRMRLVRRALLQGEDATVTHAAVRHGFLDVGRFAAAYRGLYGEFPSDTLARTRCALATRTH